MTETVSRSASADGWDEPTKNLPPLEVRDLPEPVPLGKLIGASVILLATALGSGELLIWPYITTQAGVGLLWLATVGFLAQYFLNMEIERYTLATGETAVTGFSRFWKPWGIVFALGAILPNAFPGWAASAATSLTYLFGLSDTTVPWIVTVLLLSIGLAITVSPVVYNTIERVEMVLVVVILAFLLLAIVVATDLSAWTGIVTEAPAGVASFPRYVNEIGIATILGAIAFAGAGGANNLCQSNYIRDKGMGMGVHIPRIVSPITGEEEARPATGYSFEVNEENMRRWDGRQQEAAPDLRHHRVADAHRPLRAGRLGPWRGNLRRSREHRLLEGRGEGARRGNRALVRVLLLHSRLRGTVLDQHRHRGLRLQAHRRLAQDGLPGQE
jgi:hypothetical protein